MHNYRLCAQKKWQDILGRKRHTVVYHRFQEKNDKSAFAFARKWAREQVREDVLFSENPLTIRITEVVRVVRAKQVIVIREKVVAIKR